MNNFKDYSELKYQFTKWQENGVEMSVEVKRLYWRELKALESSSRCHKPDGTVCREKCKNCEHYREGDFSFEAFSEAGGQLRDESETLDELMIQKELCEALHSAIRQLSLRDQTIIKMSFFENAPQEEIVRATGRSRRSVYNDIRRILAELREKLAEYR